MDIGDLAVLSIRKVVESFDAAEFSAVESLPTTMR